MDEVVHIGTGRFSWLTMRPMSLYESGDSNGTIRLLDLFDSSKKISGIIFVLSWWMAKKYFYG